MPKLRVHTFSVALDGFGGAFPFRCAELAASNAAGHVRFVRT